MGLYQKFLIVIALYLLPATDSFYAVANEKNTNELDFYLWTVGLGSQMESRYGHTILRFRDPELHKYRNVNWGMFNFQDPYLALNFFLGKIRYWVAEERTDFILRRYMYFDKRPLLGEKINLTHMQKNKLLRLVERNLEEDKKFFWYLYFFRNCATIPRDLLDQVFNGKIKERFHSELSELKFRDYVRVNLNRPPIFSFLVDIIMNDRVDGPLSKWDEMFYPPKLREYLLSMPAINDLGENNPEKKLLSESKVLVKHKDYPSENWRISPYFLVINLLGLLLGSLKLQNYALRPKIRWPKISFNVFEASRLQYMFLAFWGAFSGFMSTVMLVCWMFSYNLDLHHNANLFVFWPVDFVFMYIGMKGMVYKKSFQKQSRLTHFSVHLSLLHLITLPVWVVCCWAQFINQNCDWVISYIVPVALAHYFLILLWNQAYVKTWLRN